MVLLNTHLGFELGSQEQPTGLKTHEFLKSNLKKLGIIIS